MNQDTNWTPNQLEAIEARNQNLLVSAGAGSGKTAVLVERIIRLITDPVRPADVDRLLVVTFTKAAAAEMRRRVGEALTQELNRNPGSEILERQLRLLPQAQITTLHAFCGDVLRRYHYLLDLDPEFRIADETEAAILRQETLAALFEEQYQRIENDSGLQVLVEGYGGERDDLKLQELVLRLHHFAQSNLRPADWLRRAAGCGRIGEGFDGAVPMVRALRKLVEDRLRWIQHDLETALGLAGMPGGPEAYRAAIAAEVAAVGELVSGVRNWSWDELRRRMQAFAFAPRLPRAGAEVDQELKEFCAACRKQAKERFRDLYAQFFAREPGALLADQAAVAPVLARLADLTVAFGEAYRRAKRERNLVDFADLEHYCLQVLLAPDTDADRLVPSEVALEFREFFVEVLVDEYQDINAVQEAILTLVSRSETDRPNLFMVGDVKQSIYRFRLADPNLFLRKYREYPTAHGRRTRRIDLAHNFRSREEIIWAVNYLFRRIMTEAVGELEYDRAAELVYGRRCVTPAGVPEPVEVHLLERRPAEAEDTAGVAESEPGLEWDDEEADATQREARLVAGIIQRLVRGTASTGPAHILEVPQGTLRPVRYRDIVILLRATAGKVHTYLEELRRLEIPAYAKTETGYFEATEVAIALALLKVIDNPRQDIPLAAVLRSPIVGLSAAELAAVRAREQSGDFYGAVIAAAGKQDALAKRLSDFLARLDRWRTQARRGSLADLIWTVYRETGFFDYVGALPGGAARQANLRALYDRARQYEATAFRGLFRFLRYLELLREGGQDLGPAPVLAESEDVVRVMSIHQSKGLEFPVVILADLGRRFHMPDLQRDVLFHQDLGLGAYFVDPDARVSYPTVGWHVLREKLYREQLAEELRILYVAMTRARERLILTGSVSRLPQALFRWNLAAGSEAGPLPGTVLVQAQNYLDWLIPALMAHPDAEPLRREAGRLPSRGLLTDPSRWEVHLYHRHGAETEVAPAEGRDETLLDRMRQGKPVPVEDKTLGAVQRILAWRYPRPLLASLPAKIAATELKGRLAELEAEDQSARPCYHRILGRQPRFLQSPGTLSAAEFGTAMHLVLRHLELGGDLSPAGVKKQVAGLVERQILSAAEAEAIDAAAIAGFLAGPLGRRLREAVWIRREWPFYLRLPAREAFPESGGALGDETVVIQGIIDCLFAEPDGLVLIDYKTDRAAGEGVKTLPVDKYRDQLNLYARAVEAILGQRVKERYLQFFTAGAFPAVRF